jgi:membrane fusion protein, multidrug efflux system
MTKRAWAIGVAVVLALGGAAIATREHWTPKGAVAKAPAVRAFPVEIAKAVRKSTPVRVESLGTVTPIHSVAIKPRVESIITDVHFADGANVKRADVLFTLDCRQVDAEIMRVEAVIVGAQAQLEQALRDVSRYTDLVAKNATTVVTLNNAQTQVNMSRASAESNKATLENLRVQRDYCTIRAPISGRISAANVKVGNFVRPADTAPLVTINQMAPIYVSFTVPQRNLADVRRAIAAESATVEVFTPGESKPATGTVTMYENTVDVQTGMLTLRATVENKDEMLWPGTLVNTQLTLRTEDAVVIPAPAVQVGQSGNYVFVVKDGTASVRPVKVARTVGREAVIAEGLEGDETVVVDGQLLLTDGVKVAPRAPRGAGS